MKKLLCILLIPAFLLLINPTFAKKIYFWTDKNGVIHISDTPEKQDFQEEIHYPPDTIKKTVFQQKEENCFSLGYRFGLCATKSMFGLQCKPENDIVIPVRCRGKTETNKGTEAGVKEVYKVLNLNPDGSKSSYSINMLTTPLSTLSMKLEGKTKSEVKMLVGNPDRVEYFAGKECWIYGNTRTSKDRGIVFERNKVLTVTFY